jgi:hypothetical protein
VLQPAQLDGRIADETAPAVAVPGDLAGTVYLGSGLQGIGKTEPVRGPLRLKIIGVRRRRVVVVRESRLEGDPETSGDSF